VLVPHARGARVPGPRRPATTRRSVLRDHLGGRSPELGVVAHAKSSGSAGTRRGPPMSLARGRRSARTTAPHARGALEPIPAGGARLSRKCAHHAEREAAPSPCADGLLWREQAGRGSVPERRGPIHSNPSQQEAPPRRSSETADGPRRSGVPANQAARARLGAVGDGWVFRQASKDAPWAPAQCQDYLRQAEAAAGVEKLDGGLWHAYRRKWATERTELSLKDVAAAGGWKDVTTLLTCYQHADEATMLKVMASPIRLVSRRTASALEKR